MDTRDAYAAWALTYDAMENPTRDLDRAATREVLGGLRVRRILEIGCGTGKNTEFLAEIGGQVRALDFSEAMLARARAKIDAANVTFEMADITRPWPCADGSADLIVCNLVLEHIADLDPVFAEAARTLAPGGTLFICELHPAKQYQGARARFAHGDGQIEPPAFVHHVSDFAGAAGRHGLGIVRLDEWWRTPEREGTPSLVSFLLARAQEPPTP